MDSILLSICIPTYNRASFLNTALAKIKEQLMQVHDNIEVIISDNCSTDNTSQVVQNHIDSGFTIRYVRNNKNLGMDGNFIQCFNMAKGKYLWLLGDDDFLKKGALAKIVNIIRKKNYGLVHLQSMPNITEKVFTDYSDYTLFLNTISHWITFISGNIVNTMCIPKIDFTKYNGTLLSQVPLYMEAAISADKNVIIYDNILEGAIDGESNGGYNFFQVFVANYLKIWREFVSRELLSKDSVKKEKYLLFKNFICGFVFKLLVNNLNTKFERSNGWDILLSEYKGNMYFYLGVCKCYIKKYLNV